MRLPTLIATSLLTSVLAAQTTSSTLPKGWDTTEGVEIGSTNNSVFFAGFDIVNGTTSYNPARVMFMYDASQFPWDASRGTVITKIAFRRDGLYFRGASSTTTAHDKEWAIVMSTSNGYEAGRANLHHFESNHGTNRAVVFGKVGTGKKVSFKATPAPTTGTTAPFDVVVPLDRPFVVPGNAKTFVLEIRSYKASVTSGWWRVDSVQYPNNYSAGSYVLTNTDHCVTPSIFYNSRPMILNSNFGHIWRSNLSPGGKPVISWLGIRNTTLFAFPGTKCNVHVYPAIFIRNFTSGTSGSYGAYIDWGRIPNNTQLVGQSVSHQAMFVDSQYPGGVGLTRGGTSTVGTGYDPKVVKATQVYSYGHLNARYVAAVDPDKEVNPRYFYRRAPIVKIN